jgi:competence protein ComEC
VLGAGLLAGLLEPVLPSAALALAHVAGWSASYISLVAHAVASLPAAQLRPRETVVVTVLGVAAAILARRHARLLRRHAATMSVLAGTAVAGAGLWWWQRPPPVWHPPPGFRITFLDVGQGDATLLEAGRAIVLVDEGPPEADVAGQLRRLGLRELTAMVLTHPQRDHVGGAADVLRKLDVGAILDPSLEATGPERDEAVAVARARGVRVTAARAGTVFRAGSLVLRVWWPDDAGTPSEDPNLNAVVLIASVGDVDVLLSADAESDVTRRLDLPEVEVMKVAHHGSADPGLPELLERVRPRVAVIQVGTDNDYGHPRPETLQALDDARVRVFRNDLDGRVVIVSDGSALTVTTSK